MSKIPLIELIAMAVLLCLGILHCNGSNGGNRSQRPLPSLTDQPNDSSYSLEAQLDGQYVTGIRIDEGNWSAIGPRQTIELTFRAEGMSGIGQFEIDIELDPPSAFDVAGSAFVPVNPFITLPGGIDPLPDIENKIKIAAADLTRTTSGDAVLGTLNLKTSAGFSPQTQARIRIVFFSMGPDSQNRNSYSAQDLNMGLTINQQ
jgi:hypothetical protein